MAYGDFKDSARRTASDKVLKDLILLKILLNPNYDGYQRGLASTVYKSFDKKSKGSGVIIEVKPSEHLAEELHKSIIKNFLKRAAYSGSKDNIWEVDLADM